jgi:hypothetical protein
MRLDVHVSYFNFRFVTPSLSWSCSPRVAFRCARVPASVPHQEPAIGHRHPNLLRFLFHRHRSARLGAGGWAGARVVFVYICAMCFLHGLTGLEFLEIFARMRLRVS